MARTTAILTFFTFTKSRSTRLLDRVASEFMNQDEFEHFVASVRPRLHALCLRFLARTNGQADAEDLVQETLLRMWTLMKAKLVDNPEAMAIRMAKNLCIDHYRLSSRRHTPVQGVPEEQTTGSNPEQELMARELKERIDAALEELTEAQRRMVRMKGAGMDNGEIAVVCNTSRDCVKSTLCAARRKMMNRLKGGKT